MQETASSTTINTESPSLGKDMADLVNQGKSALEAGNLESALKHFEEVVRCFPERPEGHNNLGALYASLGKAKKAEACFDQVLDLIPGNPNIHYNRGLMRARQEKFAAATLDFEVALERNPQDPDVLNNLGVAAFLAGDASRAQSHFQAALAAKPDHLGALINLCDLDEATNKSAQAVMRCRKYLECHNDYPVRRRLLGLLLSQGIKNLEAAADEARALLAVNPKDDEVAQEWNRLNKALPHLRQE